MKSESMVQVNRFTPRSRAEGPGLRAALWVQGCSIHCPGCGNRETWSPRRGFPLSVDELYQRIEREPGLEGVTFVGGEPFEQAPALARLGERCKSRGLSVMTFSGYGYQELKAKKCKDWNALLAVTDLLLAGPYLRDVQDFSRPWVGSLNQEFVFLTDRYDASILNCGRDQRVMETHINRENRLEINGLYSESDLLKLSAAMADLGLDLAQPPSAKQTCQSKSSPE